MFVCVCVQSKTCTSFCKQFYFCDEYEAAVILAFIFAKNIYQTVNFPLSAARINRTVESIPNKTLVFKLGCTALLNEKFSGILRAYFITLQKHEHFGMSIWRM